MRIRIFFPKPAIKKTNSGDVLPPLVDWELNDEAWIIRFYTSSNPLCSSYTLSLKPKESLELHY